MRPENSQERNSSRSVEIIDNQSLVFDPWHMTKGTRSHSVTTRRAKNMSFGFDRVFGPTATQEEVYAESTEGIVDSVLDGYNATVFAYGATGSGKTHTMMGNDRVGPGVMGLAMCELWNKIEKAQEDYEFEVSVSCLEVYNETLHDLFVETSSALEMWDAPDGHCVVPNLSAQHPHSVEEVQKLLMEANSRRRQSPTDANQESSRSHAVFMVTVTKKPKVSGLTTTVLEGKLNLIDLAGSERASKTSNSHERFIEGANINKSLLALASCINALGQNYRTGQHVPFRNSKLTRLLKDSLGGRCRTTMIAAVSPSSLSYEDTFNTLNYASRTRNIKINAARKAIPVRANLGQYREKIESLNTRVEELKAKVESATSLLDAIWNNRFAPLDSALVERVRTFLKKTEESSVGGAGQSSSSRRLPFAQQRNTLLRMRPTNESLDEPSTKRVRFDDEVKPLNPPSGDAAAYMPSDPSRSVRPTGILKYPSQRRTTNNHDGNPSAESEGMSTALIPNSAGSNSSSATERLVSIPRVPLPAFRARVNRMISSTTTTPNANPTSAVSSTSTYQQLQISQPGMSVVGQSQPKPQQP